MKKIVVMGGGTGSYVVLRGLKQQVGKGGEIVAVMAMADDGGSNKVLRDEFGLLPTSGIRQAIVALSEDESLLRELFTYRYWQGTGISGMTFGNLFMAALADILQSQERAIEETCRLLKVRGGIVPVTWDSTHLLAEYEGGLEILGEHMIDEAGKRVGSRRIVSLRTVPKAKVSKAAKEALATADLIVMGPGDLYTNTIANLVVAGVREAIESSRAKVVLVMNLMTKLGETAGYKASDFLNDLGKYLDLRRVDSVVINTDWEIDSQVLEAYKKEGAEIVEDDLGEEYRGVKVVRAAVRSRRVFREQKGDKVRRSMVRHDADKLARVLVSCIM